jgi:hypothetical protein
MVAMRVAPESGFFPVPTSLVRHGRGDVSVRPGGFAFDPPPVERSALNHAVGPVLDAEEV